MLSGTLKKIIVLAFLLLFNLSLFTLPINKSSIKRRKSYNGEKTTRRNYKKVRAYTKRRVSTRKTRNGRKKSNSGIKKIKTIIGENFIITLKRKNIDGVWAIQYYSKKYLELIENRRSVRNTYFIFKPIKKGVATVRIFFKTHRGIRDKEIYTVAVLTPDEFRKSIAKIEDAKNGKMKNPSESESNHGTKNNPEKIAINNSGNESENQENAKPTDTEQEKSHYNLIRDLLTRKAYNQAINESQNFIKKYQNSRYLVDVIINAGKAYAGLKQHAKAVSLYTRYIKKVKNANVSFPVYFARAKSYEKMGKEKQAQIAYIKMLNVFKGKPEILAKTHLRLGKLYLKNKNFTLGLNELERLVKNYPEQGDITAEAYYHLGKNYYKTKGIEDYEKSYKSFNKLVVSFPDSHYAGPARRMARYLKKNYIDYR